MSLCLVIPTCRGVFWGVFWIIPRYNFYTHLRGYFGGILNYTLVDELGLRVKVVLNINNFPWFTFYFSPSHYLLLLSPYLLLLSTNIHWPPSRLGNYAPPEGKLRSSLLPLKKCHAHCSPMTVIHVWKMCFYMASCLSNLPLEKIHVSMHFYILLLRLHSIHQYSQVKRPKPRDCKWKGEKLKSR